MNNGSDIFLNLIDKERNIYELADLYPQNRAGVDAYIDMLQDPETGQELKVKQNKVIGANKYDIKNNVIFFQKEEKTSNWDKLNKQFLKYHKSLTTYTMLNSTPIINYLALKTGLGGIKNQKVLDVGGGTGHTYASFFQYPESVDYYLLDPNLRLLHDQFIRIYPKLTYLQMKHIIAKAEHLPIKDNTFDMVISISAIDHLEDYKAFLKEAYRVLKPNGKLLVSSHLDIAPSIEDTTGTSSKLFSSSLWERIARYLYYRKYAVAHDDHTLHLKNEQPIVDAMSNSDFSIDDKEVFKRYFYVVGTKK